MLAKRTVLELAASLPASTTELPYPHACRDAIMTVPDKIPPAALQRLDLIMGHYISS
jgi:hypothetical protein